MFVKIDPNVWLGHSHEDAPALPIAQAVLAVLEDRGWRLSADQIQFKNTLLIDLRPDEDRLLAQMKSKTRYNIRLTDRRGVSVRRGSESDLNTFYELYSETSQRDGFLIRPAAYYLDLWTQFMRASRASLLLAEKDGQTIASLMLFHFGSTAWYMYGASSNRHRNLMPNYRLQWEAMQLAKQLGCTQYDLWGAPNRFDEEDPMWGVYRFKVGFGGKTMRGIGAHDYAPSRWLYWIYTAGMPILLSLMRRQHWKGNLRPGATMPDSVPAAE
jgi:lipid II:glycine glycyltransferase (peptidoglycan interpeptide bridge formation enzyme)